MEALGKCDQITSPKETTAMEKNGYLFIYILAFETGFSCVAQIFLELVILPPQPLDCLDGSGSELSRAYPALTCPLYRKIVTP